jgi:FMN-dependent NADH-azoreductase
LNEFLAADVVVLGAAMYNFTIASQLKAWIDRILVVGRHSNTAKRVSKASQLTSV